MNHLLLPLNMQIRAFSVLSGLTESTPMGLLSDVWSLGSGPF